MKTLFSRWKVTCALLLACVTLAARPAAAVDTEAIKHSVWDSVYTTANGGRVNATVVLDGSSGSYDIPGARGRLSNIQYQFDTGSGNGEWFASIQGDWSLGSSRGSFRFTSRSDRRPIRFQGDWSFANGSGRGTWNGQLVKLVAQQRGSGPGTGSRPGGGGQVLKGVKYSGWKAHLQKPYHYRVCSFPGGGHQYLIYYGQTDPEWVYWFNPASGKFWCACPTKRHPDYGAKIAGGADLFVKCSRPASKIEDCQFPDNIDDNLVST